jgi:type II secretory pathway pseudopilin PulG
VPTHTVTALFLHKLLDEINETTYIYIAFLLSTRTITITMTKSNQGYSLISLIFGLSIVGAISAMATYNLASITEAIKLQAQCELLKNNIEKAIIKAQLSKQTQSIVFSETSWSEKSWSEVNHPNSLNLLPTNMLFEELPKDNQLNLYSGFITEPSSIVIKSKQKQCKITLSLRSRITISYKSL